MDPLQHFSQAQGMDAAAHFTPSTPTPAPTGGVDPATHFSATQGEEGESVSPFQWAITPIKPIQEKIKKVFHQEHEGDPGAPLSIGEAAFANPSAPFVPLIQNLVPGELGRQTRAGTRGAASYVAEEVESPTPLDVVTVGLGAAGKAPGVVGRVASAAGKAVPVATGAGLAAEGLTQAAQGNVGGGLLRAGVGALMAVPALAHFKGGKTETLNRTLAFDAEGNPIRTESGTLAEKGKVPEEVAPGAERRTFDRRAAEEATELDRRTGTGRRADDDALAEWIIQGAQKEREKLAAEEAAYLSAREHFPGGTLPEPTSELPAVGGRESLPGVPPPGAGAGLPPPPEVPPAAAGAPEGELYLHLGGEQVRVRPLLRQFLSDITKGKTGGIIIPGAADATPYERLVALTREKSLNEVASILNEAKPGLDLTERELGQFMVGASESGGALGELSHIGKLMREMRSAYLEQARNDPKVQAELTRLAQEFGHELDLGGLTNGFFAGRNLWEKMKEGASVMGSIARVMVAGTMQVAVNNGLNGSFQQGVGSLADLLGSFFYRVGGQPEKAAEVFARGKAAPGAILKGWASAFIELQNVLKAAKEEGLLLGVKRAVRAPQGTKEVNSLIELAQAHGREDLVDQVFHMAPPDLAKVPGGRKWLEDLKTHLLFLNTVSDHAVRFSSLLTHVTPLAQRFGGWEMLTELAAREPAIRAELTSTLEAGMMDALRASGGLKPLGALRTISKIFNDVPLLVPVMPFPKYVFGNFYPLVVESFPGLNRLSKRVRDSLELPKLEEQLSQVKAQRGKAWEGVKAASDPAEKETLQRSHKVLQAEADRLKTQIRTIRSEGPYTREQVFTHSLVGPILMSAFALWRAGSKGDDPSEFDQVHLGGDRFLDISSYLGPFRLWALLGDMVGSQAIGSDRYGAEKGFARFRDVFEAASSQRFGGAKLSEILEAPQTSWTYIHRQIQSLSSELGRMLSTGAFYGDIARRGEELVRPEAAYARRVDAPVAESIPGAVVGGFGRGLAMGTPGLREMLPPSPNWAAGGEPYKRVEPMSALVGMDLPHAFSEAGKGNVSGALANLLPGRREEVGQLQAFLKKREGFMEASSVLPRRSESPEFDSRLAHYWGIAVKDSVTPLLPHVEEAEKLDPRWAEAYLTAAMRQARSWAQQMALWDQVAAGDSLPEGMYRTEERYLEERNRHLGNLPAPKALRRTPGSHMGALGLPAPPGY